MKKAKVFTVINYILSAVLWLLGILTLLFNILGLWTPWHLVCFAFMLYIPVPAISQFLAILFCGTAEKKGLLANLIAFAVSTGFILLTVFISAKYFY